MTTSDDPRADRPLRYVLTGLASLVMLVLFIGLLVAPLAWAFSLLRRQALLPAMGVLGLYGLLCTAIFRRLFRK